MDALRMRQLGNRLLGEQHSSLVELEGSSNNYSAIVVDPIARLGRWFQKDAQDPKSRTNVYFHMEITGDDEANAEQLMDDFAVGARFTYNGQLYSVERLLPVRLSNLTIFMYLIADPL